MLAIQQLSDTPAAKEPGAAGDKNLGQWSLRNMATMLFGDVRQAGPGLQALAGGALISASRARDQPPRRIRGSPNRPKTAVSANQVIAVTASPASVTTIIPQGRAI